MSGFGQFVFYDLGVERLDTLRPLWQKLSQYHAGLSPHFGDRRREHTFDQRKQELLRRAQSGQLLIQLVATADEPEPVAYCVASVLPDGTGQIDSLFVDDCYRGCGVGTELVRRAVAWLDRKKAGHKTVIVAHGNEPVLAFYQRFGFRLDTVTLRQGRD